ncbi:MAG: thioester domain-containing protein [Syntrophales bacterium]|nr:thioester domain-containing protein [Syntrophales bacterium]
MKNLMRTCFLVLCLFVIPLTVSATPVNFKINAVNGNSYDLRSGQFNVTIDFDGALPFESDDYDTISFCVDRDNNVSIGDTYLAELNQLPNDNWITAAWLMDTYAPGFHGGAGLGSVNPNWSANETMAGLQMAIWFYVGENVPNPSGSGSPDVIAIYNYLKTMTLQQPDQFTGSNYRWADLYHISSNERHEHQDQLVRVPVPEPGTLMLLGLGLFGLGLARRKK